MSGGVTIDLVKPVTLGSETIKVLNLREPVAKDLRKLPLDAMSMGVMLDLAGDLCGQPNHVIDQLGIEDTRNVLEAVGGFLSGFQATGGK